MALCRTRGRGGSSGRRKTHRLCASCARLQDELMIGHSAPGRSAGARRFDVHVVGDVVDRWWQRLEAFRPYLAWPPTETVNKVRPWTWRDMLGFGYFSFKIFYKFFADGMDLPSLLPVETYRVNQFLDLGLDSDQAFLGGVFAWRKKAHRRWVWYGIPSAQAQNTGNQSGKRGATIFLGYQISRRFRHPPRYFLSSQLSYWHVPRHLEDWGIFHIIRNPIDPRFSICLDAVIVLDWKEAV